MKLRVLMYHCVSEEGPTDDLTVSKQQLLRQFNYLNEQGYNSISFSQLIAHYHLNVPLPPKPVLITFDDGFKNNFDIAYPLACTLKIKINLFLVPAFIIKGSYRGLDCLGVKEIAQMDPSVVQMGLHAFGHDSYTDLSATEIDADLRLCRHYMEVLGITWQPCLAYPFGAYPKRKGVKQTALFKTLDTNGIRLAFRIGNRLNRLPLDKPFQVQRCDIRGDESFNKFKWSLRLGKKWL